MMVMDEDLLGGLALWWLTVFALWATRQNYG